jgi:hypothetical protein
VRAIDELIEYVRPLAGKALTPDEEEELEKLEQEFWDARAATKLWPPPVPDPNPDDLPPEQHWDPRGLADLYTGPNRGERKPDEMEWLFVDRLQIPPGWLESMARLRRTAQRRASGAGDSINAQAAENRVSGGPSDDAEHARRVIADISAGYQRFINSLPTATTPEQESKNAWAQFRYYMEHVQPYNAMLEMSRSLAAKGVEPPYFSSPSWERLARTVGTDPSAERHEIYQAAMDWAQREGNLARVRRIAVVDLPSLPQAPPAVTPPPTSPAPPAGPVAGLPNSGAERHALFEFRDRARRIIDTAGPAYQPGTMNRSYWDEYGTTPAERHRAVYDLFRAVADAGIAEITTADQWGRLGITSKELNDLLHGVTWNLGQAASVFFPHDDDRHSSTDDLHRQTIQRLLSAAAGYLEQLRPVFTSLDALCRPPVPSARLNVTATSDPPAATAAHSDPARQDRTGGNSGGRKMINERMIATLKSNPEAMNWSAQRWADELKCSKSSVAETDTWKTTLRAMKARERAERELRRRAR